MHNPYAMAAFVLVRAPGLEPDSLEWHSRAQPIYHARIVEKRPGIEPGHCGFADRRVPISPAPQIGRSCRNRTRSFWV
jgi:hypothetical protein